MFHTDQKLHKRIEELKQFRYREVIKIASFLFCEDVEGRIGQYPPMRDETSVIHTGACWQGRDKYVWLTSEMEIPSSWSDRKIVGLFDFGRTGGGTNSGFESLLFVDGKPYQGVDMNHQEVFFNSSKAGEKVRLQFRLWSGLEGGGPHQIQKHKLAKAELAWLDEATDDLYFTAKAMLDTALMLDSNRAERMQLIAAVDRAMLQIDWSRPGSTSFYDIVKTAREQLKNELKRMDKKELVSVTALGHTHIDVAWLWQLKHTREKAARSFSTVLRLMDQYPEYTFLQTQPQLYEYIQHDYPEIFEQIVRRVQEGRWEVDGAMWLEADCNIPSGEALVRQLLIGMRFIREHFGVKCKYLWLPDVFGYSWALPQILKKSGIDTFMTTKISWNEYNRMPHDTFWWRGIDGTEILTHFITTPDADPDIKYFTYNGELTAKTVHGTWNNYQNKELNQELLISYGYGDGGGGVNRDMLEMRRRLNEIPGNPHVKTGRADQYFERLHERVKQSDQYIHTWDGELYLEYHRGTFTSQAYNKKMNRLLELKFRETEWMCTLQALQQNSWDEEIMDSLQRGWKIILRNQFHDIIPGSSIREVYEDSRKEYDEALSIVRSKWDQASAVITLSVSGSEYSVFNSSPWQRTDLVQIAVNNNELIWTDTDGNRLNAQNSGDNWLVEVPGIPPTGMKQIRCQSGGTESMTEKRFQYSDGRIETPYYQIEWNEFGQLIRIWDRRHQREVLPPGEFGNVLQLFEDKPMSNDAWNIDLFYQQKMEQIQQLNKIEMLEEGPLQTVVRFQWQYMSSQIQQDIVLYSHSPRIDFRTEVEWRERQKLLKAAFPVQIRATTATFDIQYGNVQRPTHWNTSWDMARFETVMHQWVDVSETGYGVSLLNDSKYGCDIKDNMMRLTLLKSAVYPDTEADQGNHQFTYSLLPHGGDWLQGKTVEQAWYLNNPLTYRQGITTLPDYLFKLSEEHVMIDAVKKSEYDNRIVFRVHDYSGARKKVTVQSGYSINSWQECNLMEQPIAEKMNGNPFQFDLNPYEIKTFLLEMEGLTQ